MPTNAFTGFIDINHHGILCIKGPDAKKFLQGQVTCDIDTLDIEAQGSLSSLGAHCTPKGRMLFSFRIVTWAEDTYFLSIVKTLLADAHKALQKYAVFSKVEINDVSDQYTVLGLDHTQELPESIPTISSVTNHASHDELSAKDKQVAVTIGDTYAELWLPKEKAQILLTNMPSSLDSTDWTRYQIESGIGEVMPETVDTFIPQMLNFQAIATGISFTKGCYTGQEVVARMQYLGKLKRRLFRFNVDTDKTLSPGMPLYTEGNNNQQSIGNIVIVATRKMTAEDTPKNATLLAVVKEDAADRDKVYLDSDLREKLEQKPLPYAIPKE